jgi:SAM-dependent methyltransferase
MDNKYKDLYQAEYFEDRFVGRDIKREKSYQHEYQKILEYLAKGKVLDVGCGMGNFLEVFGDNWEKYGIEISDYAAKNAEQRGIRIIDYDYEESFFDLIVFRGVFQHLDSPLHDLQRALKLLKKGGYIVFLATPNTNSIYYKLFGNLPMLDPARNFVIPSDIILKQILENFGCEVQEIRYPYIGSPYASYLSDHLKFLGKCIGLNYKFAFWKNSMEVYAEKR